MPAAPDSIDFTRGGNSAPWLGIGWAEAEPHGSWTVGEHATLRLPGRANPPACTMALLVRPYLAPPRRPFQDLLLYLNEVRVLARRLTGAGTIRFAIPDGAVARFAPITLRLRCPGATSPRSLGMGGDPRPLGVSVVSLRVFGAE